MPDKITILNERTALHRLKRYFRKGLIATTTVATIYGSCWFIPRAWNQYKLDEELNKLYLTYDIDGSFFDKNNVMGVFEKLEKLEKKDYLYRAPLEEKKEKIVKKYREKFSELVSILQVTAQKGLFHENEMKFCEKLAKCGIITEETKNDFFEKIKRHEEMIDEAELANKLEKSEEASFLDKERMIEEKRIKYKYCFFELNEMVKTSSFLSYYEDIASKLEICENLAQNKFISEEELNVIKELVKSYLYNQVNKNLKESNPTLKLRDLKSARDFSKRTGIVYEGLENELVEAYIVGSFRYDYVFDSSKIINKLDQIIQSCESADKPLIITQDGISEFFETFSFEVNSCASSTHSRNSVYLKEVFAKAETVISYFEFPEKESKLKEIVLRCFDNIESEICFIPDFFENVLELVLVLEYLDERYDLKKEEDLKRLLCSMIKNSNSAEVLHDLFFYALEKSRNMEDEKERKLLRFEIASACLSSDGSRICSEKTFECFDYVRSIYLAYGFEQNSSIVRTVDGIINTMKNNKTPNY